MRPRLHPASIVSTPQIRSARLVRGHGLKHRPLAHTEVIVMTVTSQRTHSADPGPARPGILSRWLRALRDFRAEQAYAWDRYLQSSRSPQPYRDAPAATGRGHAAAGSGSSPAGAARGDQAG